MNEERVQMSRQLAKLTYPAKFVIMSNSRFQDFVTGLDKSDIHVIDKKYAKSGYVPIDLSIGNQLLREVDVTSAAAMETFIKSHVAAANGEIAFGGYLEVRNLYQRSKHFKNPDSLLEERNIHLGIDIWADAGTDVLAVLDGEVHSFANNMYYGDYGPTIVLKHMINDLSFYTLYGHMSILSIPDLEIEQQFKKGEVIGQLGDPGVNGDYAPHLHFQVILDMGDFFGDYPGVCSKENLDFYLDNCPDPNMLLGIGS